MCFRLLTARSRVKTTLPSSIEMQPLYFFSIDCGNGEENIRYVERGGNELFREFIADIGITYGGEVTSLSVRFSDGQLYEQHAPFHRRFLDLTLEELIEALCGPTDESRIRLTIKTYDDVKLQAICECKRNLRDARAALNAVSAALNALAQ